MLNNSGESGHPCLVPDHRENTFSFSPSRIMFSVDLSYMGFTRLRQVPSMLIFLKSFNHKWVLNFVKGLFCIYWDYYMVFIFKFVNMAYHIDWFAYIEESLHQVGRNPTWSWCLSFLMCCWFCLLKFCCGFLHLCSSVMLACSFNSFCVVFIWFWYLGDGHLVEWVWKCSFLCNFFDKSFRRIGISSPLNVW